MLSLIVCSVNKTYLRQLQESVSSTVGVPHEWLIWENAEENLGLCKVYNKLAAKAQYPYLCFLHEDLIFTTANWGEALVELFEKNKKVGLVGIAGGKYKSKLFSGWYSGYIGMDFYRITHRDESEDILLSNPPDWGGNEQEVTCIDGVFMLCLKQAWQRNKFDEELLKGFHFYDIDFSLRVSRSYKVIVTNMVDVIHLTVGGDYGDKWVEQAIIYHEYAAELLPAWVAPVDRKEADIRVAKYWLDWLKNMKINWTNRVKWIRLQRLHLQPVLWYSILKFLLYKPLRLQPLHHAFKKKNS
jgi:glycosyltransferase involved in cell wall biosynthesis